MKIEIKNKKIVLLPLKCICVNETRNDYKNWKFLMLRRYNGAAHFNTEVCKSNAR